MLEGLQWRDSLVRIECQAAFEEINKVVELLGFRITHAAGGGHETGPQIAGRLNSGQGFDRGLYKKEQ